MRYNIITLIFCGLLIGCGSNDNSNQNEPESKVPDDKANEVFLAALKAHGGDAYENAAYEFVFRERNYRFKNTGAEFDYEVQYEKNDTAFVDRLDNEGFSRMANGESLKLSEKQGKSGMEALNSVIYFATLPHKLKDDAVNKSYMGEVKIKGSDYDVLKVTFDQEGGGIDYDDQYYYWINQENNLIDYLAYNYQVNEGGVRFREANNKRTVEGIVFQDYVNYKAEVGTPLGDLPRLFEENKLKKLSEINTESVQSLK